MQSTIDFNLADELFSNLVSNQEVLLLPESIPERIKYPSSFSGYVLQSVNVFLGKLDELKISSELKNLKRDLGEYTSYAPEYFNGKEEKLLELLLMVVNYYLSIVGLYQNDMNLSDELNLFRMELESWQGIIQSLVSPVDLHHEYYSESELKIDSISNSDTFMDVLFERCDAFLYYLEECSKVSSTLSFMMYQFKGIIERGDVSPQVLMQQIKLFVQGHLANISLDNAILRSLEVFGNEVTKFEEKYNRLQYTREL